MNDNVPEETASPEIIRMLSQYLGPARQRQLLFGEYVVRNQNWNIDLGKGVILFGEDTYLIQVLGTESYSRNTWLWAHKNPSIPEEMLIDVNHFYEFCQNAAELAPDEIDITDMVNGHNIASIAVASHKDKVCYYRCPYNGGAAYVLVKNIPEKVFAPMEAQNIISLIYDIIAQFQLEHKVFVNSLLEINCSDIEKKDNMFIGKYSDGTNLVIEFDTFERISSLRTEISKK